MFDSIKKIRQTFSEIDSVELLYDTPFILTITWDNVDFDFLIRLRKDSKKLFIFGNGAYDSDKFSPPVFQRHTWVEDIHESVIMYNDPTLYLGKMNIGWGQGTTQRFYLKDLSVLFNIFIQKLNINLSQVYFYGSSAGGFMSLYLAGLLKGSNAFVNNPQTVVHQFYQRHVENMYRYSYPNLEPLEIQEQFKERLEIIDFYKKIMYVPNILYLQNISDFHDVKNHLMPFISGITSLKKYFDNSNVRFNLYSNEELGHNPIDKTSTLKYLLDFSNRKI